MEFVTKTTSFRNLFGNIRVIIRALKRHNSASLTSCIVSFTVTMTYVSTIKHRIGAFIIPTRRTIVHLGYALALLILGTSIAVGMLLWSNVMWALSAPIPSFGALENRHVEESTKLYDRTGRILLYDTAGSMRRTTVPFEDISLHLKNATVAIEDDTFYTHAGVRPVAILRAFRSNVSSRSLSQGGSTITQQLIKNTLLTGDKHVSRKIKEFVLALRIERVYTKEEILATYLNETPYGGTIYGVEEASRAYFNTPAKDVTLSQAAYIAALPKAPTYFSPWGNNREALEERHDLVLQKMFEHGHITEQEYTQALHEDVAFTHQNTENIKAPHFVFYVLDELEKQYGREDVYNGRLHVVTTLDWEMQQENEKIIREGALENEKKFSASNAALVIIDPQSGQVLTMVGSRNYFDDTVDGQVNVATALRQPGSAFKPFVYATAFKKGYTPDTVLFDLKTQFSTACGVSNFSNEYPCYAPENYDNKFRGPMTIRDALAQSVNIVGVKALFLSGLEDSIVTAESLGITTLEDAKRYGLTLVLGGGEVTLLEMTGAYGAFANDGIWNKPTPILSIRDADEAIIESYTPDPKRVLEPEIARAINDILSDNEARTPAFGPNSPLYFDDVVVASKTGTTNDYRDAWVIGYTPTIVVGAWAGNSDNSPMVKSVASYILAPMWHTAMDTAIARSQPKPFEKNTTVVAVATSSSTFFDPPQGVHEMSYWTRRNEYRVQGDRDVYQDEQMAWWGYPVMLWAIEQARLALSTHSELSGAFAFGTGGPDNVPLQMNIASPERGSEIEQGKPFVVTVSHSEMPNVIDVAYFLQGAYIGRTNEPPFSFTMTAQTDGVKVLRAVARSPLGDKEALTTIVVTDSDDAQRRVSNR